MWLSSLLYARLGLTELSQSRHAVGVLRGIRKWDAFAQMNLNLLCISRVTTIDKYLLEDSVDQESLLCSPHSTQKSRNLPDPGLLI